ncbi:MAG: hypothetical protein KC800_01555 [Candidatus Eremiobacteraeota bacterium]|nr:hypothetical protein [Candidatus Eremiobacteraeota bacterium]
MRGVSAHLDRVNLNGTRALNIRNTNYNLVKRDDNGQFQPVDTIDSKISSEELEAHYGVWEDKKLTEGSLWWKKTVRELDGQVQADEVKNFPDFREGEMSHRWSRAVGRDKLYTFDSADIEVENNSGDQAKLNTEWTLYRGDWNRFWEYMSPLSPPFVS